MKRNRLNRIGTEEERQERFISRLGRTRANKLQQIWNESSPHSTYDIFKPISKIDDFRIKAKKEGFTDSEIKMFLELD